MRALARQPCPCRKAGGHTSASRPPIPPTSTEGDWLSPLMGILLYHVHCGDVCSPSQPGDRHAWLSTTGHWGVHKHGGNGWLTYDTVFHRNQEGLDSPWNILDPSLHTACVTGQSCHPLVPCKHCNEAYHAASDCALAPLTLITREPQREREPRATLPLRQSKHYFHRHWVSLQSASAPPGTGDNAPSLVHVPIGTSARSATVSITPPGNAPTHRWTPSISSHPGADSTQELLLRRPHITRRCTCVAGPQTESHQLCI